MLKKMLQICLSPHILSGISSFFDEKFFVFYPKKSDTFKISIEKWRKICLIILINNLQMILKLVGERFHILLKTYIRILNRSNYLKLDYYLDLSVY